MAPELLADANAKSSVHSDVYSLGVVLWEIFCGQGKMPYSECDDEHARLKILAGSLLVVSAAVPASVRKLLTPLLHGCWKKRPADRLACLKVVESLVRMQPLVTAADAPLAATTPHAPMVVSIISPIRLQAACFDGSDLHCWSLDVARFELYAVSSQDHASIVVFDTRTLHVQPRPLSQRTFKMPNWILAIQLDRERQLLFALCRGNGEHMSLHLLRSQTGVKVSRANIPMPHRRHLTFSMELDTRLQRLFCEIGSVRGASKDAVRVFDYELKEVATFGKRVQDLPEEQRVNLPLDYFGYVSSMVVDEKSSRIYCADIDANDERCRISVWDSCTLKPLSSFGRQRTADEQDEDDSDPPPAGTFRGLNDLHLLTCGLPPRRVLAVCELTTCYPTLLYSLQGEYLGHQPFTEGQHTVAADPSSDTLWCTI